VLGEKRNTVWRYKKSSRDKILSGKEWQRHRTPPGVNETFRCLIINFGTELNATPILLGSRTIFSLSLSLSLSLSSPLFLLHIRGNLRIPWWPEEVRERGGRDEGYTFN